MWDKTVRLKTFIATVSSLVLVVALALLFLYLTINRNSTLASSSRTDTSVSSTTALQASSTTIVPQETSTTEASSTTTSVPVSTTEKQTATTEAVPENLEKNEIIFIGDSLLAQKDTPPVLIPKLIASGWQQISINAHGGRKNHLGSASNIDFVSMLKEIENNSYDAFTSSGSPPGAHQNVLKKLYPNDQSTLAKISDDDLNIAFRQADAVVVSLGTNDKADATTMEAGIRLTVSSIKKINPTIKIYWVKMCAQGGMQSKGNIFNPILENLKEELHFELIDWASECQASHQFDGVHYKPNGVEAFTSVLAAGVT